MQHTDCIWLIHLKNPDIYFFINKNIQYQGHAVFAFQLGSAERQPGQPVWKSKGVGKKKRVFKATLYEGGRKIKHNKTFIVLLDEKSGYYNIKECPSKHPQ